MDKLTGAGSYSPESVINKKHGVARMKKFLILFSIMLAIFLHFYIKTSAEPLQLIYDGEIHQYDGKIYSLKIDGEQITSEIPPVIINDRTLVPARAVFERLGASVNWDAQGQKVMLNFNNIGISMEFKINDTSARVNDRIVQLDVPAKIVNDRTMIPLRFVGEQLKMKAGWFPDSGLVTLEHTEDTLVPANLKNVKFASSNFKDEIYISLDYYKKYNVYRDQNPDRIIVDIPNTTVPAVEQKIDARMNQVNTIRMLQGDQNTARVVLEVDGQPDYEVSEKSGQLVLYVSKPAVTPSPSATPTATQAPVQIPGVSPLPAPTPSPTPAYKVLDIKHSPKGDNEEVAVPFDSYSGYNIVRFTDPDRIVVDIPARGISVRAQTLDVNSSIVKSVRSAQFNPGTIRVVLDVNGLPQYDVREEQGQLVIIVQKPSYKNILYHNTDSGAYISLTAGIFTMPDGSGGMRSLYRESYDSTGKQYTMTFKTSVADMGEGVLKVNDGAVDSIVISQNKGTNETSITINARVRYTMQVFTYPGMFGDKFTKISFLKPLENSVIYSNTGDRVVLVMPGVKLTDGDSSLKKFFRESYDITGKKYSITFPNNIGSFADGKISINDNCLDSVTSVNNLAAGETTLTFNARDKFGYVTIYRPVTNDTAVTIFKQASPTDKIVIIDPGHGGVETGAAPSADFLEKKINLDIALRLNALLRKKNIKTYMIRDDDSYVWFYERAYIANAMKAKLFISIHNNAYNEDAQGTETLYYPQNPGDTGFNSRRLAELVQSSLTKALNTVDRKIQAHPEFVVLNSTDIPSIIAEVAFMTNKIDSQYLKKEEFRQRAAEALCDAIVQAVGEAK